MYEGITSSHDYADVHSFFQNPIVVDNDILTPIVNVFLGMEQPELAQALLDVGFLQVVSVDALAKAPPQRTKVYRTVDSNLGELLQGTLRGTEMIKTYFLLILLNSRKLCIPLPKWLFLCSTNSRNKSVPCGSA